MIEAAEKMKGKKILITGAAGFIGSYLTLAILRSAAGAYVTGIDNLNDYYDPAIKEYRLAEIDKAASSSKAGWRFIRGSIADKAMIENVFREGNFDIIVNLGPGRRQVLH